ncbi:hypothetical protein NGUA18_00032 [Salmonella enterica]|nr:hypothetical protein NGUA18_00032 [Salmonella enterica]
MMAPLPRAEAGPRPPGEWRIPPPAGIDQDHRRHRHPAHHRDIAQRQRRRPGEKNRVAKHITKIAQYAHRTERHRAALHRFWHRQQQAAQRQQSHHRNNTEQHLPVNKVHQRGTGERADNRSDQHNGGNNRHQLNGFGLTESLLYRDVADRCDKANAGALHKTGNQKLRH